MIQRLKFGVKAVFDLFNVSNGLDLDLHSHKKKKEVLLLMDKSNIERKTSMADIVLQVSWDPQGIKPWKLTK